MRSTRSTANEMKNKDADSLLTSLGRGVQYFCALFLTSAICILLLRVVQGEWPELAEWNCPPEVVRWMAAALAAVGVGGLFLGHHIKQGSTKASGMACVISLALLAFCLSRLWTTGHGWYTAALAFLLVCDALMALVYSAVKKARDSGGDDPTRGP